MTNNLQPFQQQQRTAVNDVLQQFHRMNPGSMGGLMGRGGGYNPANNTAPSMLGPLSTTFSGNSSGAPGSSFPPGAPGSVGENAPSPLDMSEFPSLSRAGGGGGATGGVVGDSIAVGGGHVGASRPGAYGNLNHGWGGMKQPTSEPSEFTMSSEDFPALPGSHKQAKLGGGQQHQQPGDIFSSDSKKGGSSVGANSTNNNSTNSTGVTGDAAQEFGSRASVTGATQGQSTGTSPASGADKNNQSKRGIQTFPDGKVTNIPNGMVRDQFGMVGLLTFIRAAESDPNLVQLALGSDLTSLGLNLNSPENLYPNFGGPWAESPCRPQDIDYHVPQEYLVNQQINMYGRNSKLAPIQFDRYGEDLLFYMFYSNAGDVWQLMAASELYNRDWRYHKDEQVWITRAPGMPPSEKGPTFERGTYFYFDVQNWRKVPKEFHLVYEKLDTQPMPMSPLNAAQQQKQQQQQQQQQQQHHNHHPQASALA